jgi:hypothetical protein
MATLTGPRHDVEDKHDLSPTCTPTTSAGMGVSESSTAIDPEKEKSALRRFDLIVLPQLFVLTIIGWLDRANIG